MAVNRKLADAVLSAKQSRELVFGGTAERRVRRAEEGAEEKLKYLYVLAKLIGEMAGLTIPKASASSFALHPLH